MSNPQQLGQKLWNYCNLLQDDGLSYGDYVEQLICLLFPKMADKQAKTSHVKSAEPSRLCSPWRRCQDWAERPGQDDDELSAVADEVRA